MKSRKMLKSAGKLAIATDLSSSQACTSGVDNISGGSVYPGTPEPSTPGGSKPRKKLSFKEPEFFGYLKIRKPSFRTKSQSVPLPHETPAQHVARNDETFKEEDEDYEELESQAMRVVRTVGQAFEVCHKLSLNTATEEREQDIDKERELVRDRNDEHLLRSEDYEDEMTSERQSINRAHTPSPNIHKDISLLADGEDPGQDQPPTIAPCILRTHGRSASPMTQSPSGPGVSESGELLMLGNNELTSLKHEVQLLRERLDQQSQQTRAAVGHARLLQDQLAAETAARVEAQTRTHQLLVQNKDLLEHISALVSHLREQDRTQGIQSQVIGSGTGNAGIPTQTSVVPDLSSLGQVTLYRMSP